MCRSDAGGVGGCWREGPTGRRTRRGRASTRSAGGSGGGGGGVGGERVRERDAVVPEHLPPHSLLNQASSASPRRLCGLHFSRQKSHMPGKLLRLRDIGKKTGHSTRVAKQKARVHTVQLHVH